MVHIRTRQICMWSNLIKLISVAFIGYGVLISTNFEFWLQSYFTCNALKEVLSSAHISTMSLKTKYVKLMKLFLCTYSQITGNSCARKISIRDLKCLKQMLGFPKSIQHCFPVICKSILSFLLSFLSYFFCKKNTS